MPEDASLEEFLDDGSGAGETDPESGSGDEADPDGTDPESGSRDGTDPDGTDPESGSRDGTDPDGTDPGSGRGADPDAGEGASPDHEVSPAVATHDWTPGGADCQECGATVERRWRDDDRMVCEDCKEW